MNDYKLGLVLSGGGVKAAAHIGVLQALLEYKISPDFVSGTSAGALIGAFYADGYSPKDICELFARSDLFAVSKFGRKLPGLLDIDKFGLFFEVHLKTKTFQKLKNNLRIVATDLINAESVTFKSGPIIPPLLASCAFPFVFHPKKIGSIIYSDGGIVNNFPVESIFSKVDYVLGVYVNPLKAIHNDNLQNTLGMLNRVYGIANRHSSLKNFDKCDWLIRPPRLENYGMFDMKKTKEICEIGYRHAVKVMPEIEKKLNLHQRAG